MRFGLGFPTFGPYANALSIWVAGIRPKRAPFRRAARYEGVAPVAGDLSSSLSADQVRELIAYVRQLRDNSQSHYDLVYSANTEGMSDAAIRSSVEFLSAAGATWWLETMVPPQWPPQQARERIRLGPPWWNSEFRI
jgi:hypothetical protein